MYGVVYLFVVMVDGKLQGVRAYGVGHGFIVGDGHGVADGCRILHSYGVLSQALLLSSLAKGHTIACKHEDACHEDYGYRGMFSHKCYSNFAAQFLNLSTPSEPNFSRL